MALWRIATALGYPHPRRLLAGISSSELTELLAFHAVEPLGEERGDLRAAIVASTLANVNRDSRKRPRPYKPEEFMPFHHREPESAEALSARIKAAFSSLKQR